MHLLLEKKERSEIKEGRVILPNESMKQTSWFNSVGTLGYSSKATFTLSQTCPDQIRLIRSDNMMDY